MKWPNVLKLISNAKHISDLKEAFEALERLLLSSVILLNALQLLAFSASII
jgi:hypothetical protein